METFSPCTLVFVNAEINYFFGKDPCEKGIMRNEEKVIRKAFLVKRVV